MDTLTGGASAIFFLAALFNEGQLNPIALRMTKIHFGLTESTVKILKIGTPEIITIIVLQLEQLDFTMQYCVQKMQTE